MKTLLYSKSLLIFFILSVVMEALHAQFPELKSQFANGYETGFNEGYCYNMYKANCLTPLPPLAPLPRLTESAQSYQDGFNRGFQTGLDLRRLDGGVGLNKSSDINYQSVPNYRYKEYVPTYPINAYSSALAYMEDLLHGRTKWIQERIQGVRDLNYSLLFNLDYNAYNNIINLINGLHDKLRDISGNFADDKIFRHTLNIIDFPGLETEIYTAYQSALSKIEKTSTENKFNNLLIEANDSLYTDPSLSLKLIQEAEDLNIKSQYNYQINSIKSSAYENLDDFKSALYFLDKYISSENITQKELQTATFQKAILLIKLQKSEDAIILFNSSIFDESDDTLIMDILFHKTIAYFNLKDYQNSLYTVDKFFQCKLVDDYSKEYFFKAMQIKAISLRELHKYQEALDIINLAIKKSNTTLNSSLYATRGKIYYQMKQYNIALDDFIRATLLNDKDGESFYYLSKCYKNLNQKVRACENLQKAIKNGSKEAVEEYPNICK